HRGIPPWARIAKRRERKAGLTPGPSRPAHLDRTEEITSRRDHPIAWFAPPGPLRYPCPRSLSALYLLGLSAYGHDSAVALLDGARIVSFVEEAAILSVDGAGEDITTWFGRGRGTRIERLHAIRLPHSLGLVYSAVTDYLGFRPWGGEGKVMGLAPYGDPDRYYQPMRDVIR